MSAIRVTDALSNRNEHLVEAVRAIGKPGTRKYRVFEAIYYHKKRIKTVSEIEQMTGLSRMQILQAGGELKKSGIVDQCTKSETAYVQIEAFQNMKGQILDYAKNPSKLQKLPTKRNLQMAAGSLSFVKPKRATRSNARPQTIAKKNGIKLRIAFLATNPDPDASLRTDVECRDVKHAVRSTANGQSIKVELFPAATLEDLIDALNEFEPQVVHFSGHGGNGTVVFDKQNYDTGGGMVLDFALVAKVIKSARTPPELLVLSACDTTTGAEQFLSTVSAVVAMSDEIDDPAACYFSARFYKSIASGATLQSALEQGKLVLEAGGFQDAELPTLIVANEKETAKRFF
jgi:CHAT domain